jgi:dipeptidyl aminopeptidase/acylaminoacyl peptidase
MSPFRIIRFRFPAAAVLAAAATTCTLLPIVYPIKVQAQAVRQYPVRDFFRHPERGYFRVSPDGKHLSFMQPFEQRMNVHVQPLDAKGHPQGEPRRITAETARDIEGYFWKGKDRILYVKDFGGDENTHVVSVAADGSGLKDLTPFDGVKASIVDDLEDDPRHILVSHNRRDRGVFDVYRIDVRTGASTLLAQNPGNVVSWVTDHRGRLRAAVTSDGVNSSLLYRATEKDAFKPVATTHFKETLTPLFFTFDNKKLYVASSRGRDKSAIFVFDPRAGREEQLVFERPDVDVGNLNYSRLRKVLTEVNYVTWKQERTALDSATAALYRTLEAKLPGYQVTLQSHTKDEKRWIVAADNDRTPGTRYLFDQPSGQLTKLGEINPSIPEQDMAPVKPIQYTSRDGLTIHGYLALPLGVEPKNLPVVVNPHGGPWARDTWGYNPELQLLANRGYAVLQVNFRGSTGYGRKFWEASFKQWGRSMQDDVTDGVQWLIKEGIADPRRIAIYGGSYGGYATLAGVAFTPDLYAAAVDYVGVANLFTFLNTIPPYWKPYLEMMYEMVGHPEKDKEALRAASPVFFADRIKTPLLVAQGARDPRVNQAESDQIVQALKQRGVQVEYLVKDNEGHGFRNQENQFEFYEAMERFLAKHLKPAPVQAAR